MCATSAEMQNFLVRKKKNLYILAIYIHIQHLSLSLSYTLHTHSNSLNLSLHYYNCRVAIVLYRWPSTTPFGWLRPLYSLLRTNNCPCGIPSPWVFLTSVFFCQSYSRLSAAAWAAHDRPDGETPKRSLTACRLLSRDKWAVPCRRRSIRLRTKTVSSTAVLRGRYTILVIFNLFIHIWLFYIYILYIQGDQTQW